MTLSLQISPSVSLQLTSVPTTRHRRNKNTILWSGYVRERCPFYLWLWDLYILSDFFLLLCCDKLRTHIYLCFIRSYFLLMQIKYRKLGLKFMNKWTGVCVLPTVSVSNTTATWKRPVGHKNKTLEFGLKLLSNTFLMLTIMYIRVYSRKAIVDLGFQGLQRVQIIANTLVLISTSFHNLQIPL